jgi:uncharacterized protein Yka (UPF0111/DUF47 family)
VDAGVIVYRVTADLSELSRAEGQAGATFARIGAEGAEAFTRITRALEESARLITGALAAAFDLSPDQLVAGAQRASEALARLQRAAADTDLDRVEADAEQAARALEQKARSADVASRSTAELGEAAEEAARRSGTLLERLGQFGMAAFGIQQVAQAMQGLLSPLAQFGRSAVEAASDANESFSKLQAVFGEVAATMNQTLAESARTMGLSRGEAAEAIATFGNLFTSMGLSGAAAGEMSVAMVQLAADIASFNNLALDEALQKLRSGLVGEIEPLRSIGVSFNEAAVQAKALEMGLASSSKELTEQDKILARYRLIMERTTNAQGDFARTSDQLANSQRILRAQLQNLREQLGSALLPIVTTVVQKLADAITWFQRMPDPIRDVSVALVALATGLGVVLPMLGGVAIAVGALSAPVVATIAVVGALAATAVLLARNWDALTQRFPALARAADLVTGALRALVEIVRNLVPVVREALSALADLVGAQFEKLKTSVTTVARIVVAAFRGEWERIPEIVEEGTRAIEEADRRQRAALERLANAHRLYGATQDRYAGRVRTNISAYYEVTGALQAQEGQLVSILEVYTQFDAVLSESGKAVSHWQRNLREAEEALRQLEDKRRAGLALTPEEQAQYETLTWYVARLTGGIADLEAQQRSILVAQAEYTRQLDELNAALSSGQISQEDYSEQVAALNREFSAALGPADQFRQAGLDVAEALGAVVDRVRGLLQELGLIPSDVTIDVRAETQIARRNLLLLEQQIDGLPRETLTTVDADTEAARQELEDTKGLVEALPAERAVRVTADTWDAQSEIELIRNRTQNLRAVIRATIDTSQVYPEIERLSRHLPRSPAEEGPLSQAPNWQWLFAGLPKAAREATDEALRRIREFAGGVRESWEAIGRAIDVVTRLSALQARGGLPDLAIIDRLADFAAHLAARLGEIAKQYETEVLEKTERLARAIGAAFDAVRGAIEVAQRWRELVPELPDFDAMIDRLVPAAERLTGALAVAADAIGAEGIAKAGVVADGMRGIWDTLRGGIEAARGLSGATLAGLDLLDRNRERIAEQLRRLVVAFSRSVAEAVSEAGAEALPERELVDRLLAPTRSILDALAAVGRAIDATEQVGAAIPRRVEALGMRLVEIGRAFAQAVAQVGEGTLPEAEVTERLFAPIRAVAALLGALSRLVPSGTEGQQARWPDLGRALQALVEGLRGAFGVIREVAGEPLPPVERLAPLSEAAGTIGRILEVLTGSSEKLRGTSPRRFERMAADIASAIREWIAQLSEVASELQPEMEQALDDLAALVAPIEAIVEPVTSALTAAASWPRRWERALDAFIEAVRVVIRGLADLRTELGGGIEDATAVAEAVARIVAQLSGLSGASFQLGVPTASLASAAAVTPRAIALAPTTLEAAVDVRIWVGDTELRQIVRQEVEAALDTMVRTVR